MLRAEEHLAALLVHSDGALTELLRTRLFAPLEAMTDKQQDRLLETLRAWLDSQANVVEIAERLQVHPQTVRYRMRQLQATFGELLRDPAARFEMELVLRATEDDRPCSGVSWPPNLTGANVVPASRRPVSWEDTRSRR